MSGVSGALAVVRLPCYDASRTRAPRPDIEGNSEEHKVEEMDAHPLLRGKKKLTGESALLPCFLSDMELVFLLEGGLHVDHNKLLLPS